MSRSGSVVLVEEPILCASVIAAQAVVLGEDGFRQRDVRFFMELFSNWLESTTGSWALTVHNVQVQRHLDLLSKVGWAKRVARKPPKYRLTPEGLVELIGRLGRRDDLRRLDEFFLVFHFFGAYGDRLKMLVDRSGPLASRTLARDIAELIDPAALVRRERATVRRAIARLSARAEESVKMSDLSRRLLSSGKTLDETIGTLEREHAYELNSQKPLTELLAGLPEPWRRVEVDQAARHRATKLWGATRELLVEYDRILEGLTKSP